MLQKLGTQVRPREEQSTTMSRSPPVQLQLAGQSWPRTAHTSHTRTAIKAPVHKRGGCPLKWTKLLAALSSMELIVVFFHSQRSGFLSRGYTVSICESSISAIDVRIHFGMVKSPNPCRQRGGTNKCTVHTDHTAVTTMHQTCMCVAKVHLCKRRYGVS